MTFNQMDVASSREDDEGQIRARRQFAYSTKALLAASQIERVFVTHDGVIEGLRLLDRVFQLSQHLDSPQGIQIVGPTGAGKSTLVRYFREGLPRKSLIEGANQTLYLRMQARPHVSWLVSELLRLIDYPIVSVSEKMLYAKRDIVIEALVQKRIKLIFVDEAHHLSTAASRDMRRIGTSVSDVLKHIVDEGKVALALIGDESLQRSMERDPHLHGRLPGRLVLRNFENGPTWRGVVMALLKSVLAVKVDLLTTTGAMTKLHVSTGGNLRQLKWLLEELVMVAVDADDSIVIEDHLYRAFACLYGPGSLTTNPYRKG